MVGEYRANDYGSYITTFGGMLQTVLLGFTGLRVSKDDWRRYNATLPEGWESIEVNRMYIHGHPYWLKAEHGKKATLEKIGKY